MSMLYAGAIQAYNYFTPLLPIDMSDWKCIQLSGY